MASLSGWDGMEISGQGYAKSTFSANNGGDLLLKLVRTRPVATVHTANAKKSDRFALGRFYVKLLAIILELCVSSNFQHV